jgi:hypothetical protein
MSRSRRQWQETPGFPNTHFVDTGLYMDPTFFREEQVNIFAKTELT